LEFSQATDVRALLDRFQVSIFRGIAIRGHSWPNLPLRAITMPFRLAIIGAGPVGIEAALAAVKDGYAVTLLEKGSKVCL